MTRKTVGVVGARGHVGAELLPLLARDPALEVVAVGSRGQAGARVSDVIPKCELSLTFEDLVPEDLARRPIDAWVLALPNGEAPKWALHARTSTVLVDLGADFRFDDRWVYGLPELGRDAIRGATRIANPGCYATAVQLALAPALAITGGTPTAFGVSGYSGAGTTPSPRNDAARLHDSLMPYSLVGHTHEREATRHLGRAVRFMPHVAGFFRGISVTVAADLVAAARSRAALVDRFRERYAREPLLRVTDEIPELRDAVERHGATVGGFAVDEASGRAVWVSTLDNLLKGAATQALQNLHLALGLDELAGIPLP